MQQYVEKKGILGKCVAFMKTIKFQKRGGPHLYSWLIKVSHTTAAIDDYISAEIHFLYAEEANGPMSNVAIITLC